VDASGNELILADSASPEAHSVAIRKEKVIALRGRPVPTAKPKQLTDARESVDSPTDERSLQIDLVRVPTVNQIRMY
jgi:hypothetical protein